MTQIEIDAMWAESAARVNAEMRLKPAGALKMVVLGTEIQLDGRERNRLVDDIVAAIKNDRRLVFPHNHYAIELVKTLRWVKRGRQVERQFDLNRRWFKNPTNLVTAVAASKIRAWRKHNKVKNNRVFVNGKWVGVHGEGAKRALKSCNRRSPKPLKTNIELVMVQLRQGRTSPNLKRIASPIK